MFIIMGIILLLIVAVLYIFIYTIPEITGALKQTCTVEYGEMRIAKSVDAVLIREETVYKADSSGLLSYYIDNNTKTRQGSKILDIYGSEKNTVLCPQTGVVSYYYDGYESVLTPGAIESAKEILLSESAIQVKDLSSERASEGEPLYKLITNDTFYTVFLVPPDDIGFYSVDRNVTLEFENGSVSAKISEILSLDENGNVVIQEGEETTYAANYLVVVSTSKYFVDYDKLRQCKLDVVLQNDKGLIVPNTAITEVDGIPGVYVKGIDGEYDFTRIKVISSDGVDSVVYADTFSVLREDGLSDIFTTISIYDEILKDASGQD